MQLVLKFAAITNPWAIIALLRNVMQTWKKQSTFDRYSNLLIFLPISIKFQMIFCILEIILQVCCNTDSLDHFSPLSEITLTFTCKIMKYWLKVKSLSNLTKFALLIVIKYMIFDILELVLKCLARSILQTVFAYSSKMTLTFDI